MLPEAYASLLARLNRRHPISFFVFENVPGLLSKRHRHRYDAFKAMFAKAGFSIHEEIMNAKYSGVPQERQRVIIVGINRKLHPKASWIPPEKEETVYTVRDAIAGLPEPIYNAPGLDPETFPEHPNHWCLVPRSSKFADAKLEEGQMYGRSFRTLYWDEPSWTVAYGHREVHVHPLGHRRLSIYEAMLLQTFPKSYRMTGNMSAQIRLVSEAVPPQFAYRIAKSIRESLGI
jgi:DNA (cytosine-5)-methyltransferase 1